MLEVNVTELRSKLPEYLAQVEAGKEIKITRRGKIIARLVSSKDEVKEARKRLVSLRKHAWVGDVITPIKLLWGSSLDNL